MATTGSLPYLQPGATYPTQLKMLADEYPDQEAFVFVAKDGNKTVLTRTDVWDGSRKYAAILQRQGITRGDIVCNTLVNSPERLLSTFGTLIAGAISMHGQVFLADGEDIIDSLNKAKCKAIIVDPGDSKGALPILEKLQHRDEDTEDVSYDGLPHLTTVINVNVVCSNGEIESHKRGLSSLQDETEMYEELNTNENDVAFIFATSGTTGFSKLVPHSHRVCFSVGRLLANTIHLERDKSRYFNDRSLGWLGGFPCLYPVCGSTRIQTDHYLGLPEDMNEHVIKLIDEERIEYGFLLPMEFESLGKRIKSSERRIKPLRSTFTGGMPIVNKLLNNYQLVTNCINICYGSSELTYVSSFRVEQGVTYEDFCCGHPLEDVDVLIIDKELKEVSPGQIGQIAVRHSVVTPAYLYDQESTQNNFTKDGFFLTSDSAYKDEKGRLFVLGREVHAIHKGIFIHYPGWLESRIQKCPGVQNVIVIGVPDPLLHEEICACIIPDHDQNVTQEQLKSYCESLLVTDLKSDVSAVPKYYLFFEAYPLNGNGKLDRKMLLKEACARLDINQE